MHILMLNYEFPPLGAGGSTSTFNLARNIVALGHKVDMVTMGFRGIPNEEVMDGIRVYRVPSVRARREVCHTHEMATYVLSGTLKAAQLAARNRYDLANAHFIFPTGPIAYALRRLRGLPYVLTARGSDVPGHNPNRFRFDHQLLRPVWRSLVQDADAIVAVSRHLAQRIEENAPGVSVRAIPNGCSPLGAADDTVRTPKSITENGRMRVLMVTRLHEFKGVQYMLEAASRVPLDLEINIVGDGPYRSTLEAQAARIGKPVRFWGWLDRNSPEMWRLYRESSVFVFPSEREGSPTVVQEAMSAGLAVVAADAAGTPEVVGDAGILVSPKDPAGIADALVRLANDPALVQELSERAFERVRTEFDWRVLAGRYVELYGEVLARTGRAPA
ncbi:MAG: glycosyltransferase family 4 protein [Chloroflexi bacterium]|nr:glycosyltransferase family 4 protein [Chloroflexota bacterium]